MKDGNLIASIGGLFTILSVTFIENQTWQIITAIIGVVLAVYGLTLTQKVKKKE